jgi:hypothetical protein
LIPKNRQNNVYGHGEVRALDAVLEAAQEDYEFDSSISVVVSTVVGEHNRIHLERGDSVSFDVVGDLETVQWRSNHLRDDWSSIHGFDHGNPSGELYLIDIVHQLEHLPGTDVLGNHTISLRGIQYNESGGQSSSTPLVTADVMIMDANTDVVSDEESKGLPAVGIIGTMAIIGLGIAASSRKDEDTVDEQ